MSPCRGGDAWLLVAGGWWLVGRVLGFSLVYSVVLTNSTLANSPVPAFFSYGLVDDCGGRGTLQPAGLGFW